jgi:hypothetical protein
MKNKLTSEQKNYMLISLSYFLSAFLIAKRFDNFIIASSIIGFGVVSIFFSFRGIKIVFGKKQNVDSEITTNDVSEKKIDPNEKFNKTGQSLYLVVNQLSCAIVFVLSVFPYFIFPSYDEEMELAVSIMFTLVNYLNVIFVFLWNLRLAEKALVNFKNTEKL